MLGFVKIPRALYALPFAKEKPFDEFHALADLMFRAAWHEGQLPPGYAVKSIKPGQVLTSQLALSEAWGWSRGRVGRFLSRLEADNLLSIQTSKETRTGYTLITLRIDDENLATRYVPTSTDLTIGQGIEWSTSEEVKNVRTNNTLVRDSFDALHNEFLARVSTGRLDLAFIRYMDAFPRHCNDVAHVGKEDWRANHNGFAADALAEWERLKPSPALVGTVMASLDRWKAFPGWGAGRDHLRVRVLVGDLAPIAVEWLRDRGWEEAPDVDEVRDGDDFRQTYGCRDCFERHAFGERSTDWERPDSRCPYPEEWIDGDWLKARHKVAWIGDDEVANGNGGPAPDYGTCRNCGDDHSVPTCPWAEHGFHPWRDGGAGTESVAPIAPDEC
jgi:hypothetical protein